MFKINKSFLGVGSASSSISSNLGSTIRCFKNPRIYYPRSRVVYTSDSVFHLYFQFFFFFEAQDNKDKEEIKILYN